MPTPLEIGVGRTVKVRADQFWTDTGIALVPGRYRFEAGGRWSDWFIRSGPEGYHALPLLFFERQRRVSGAPWMVLVGAIGHDDATAFVIGTGVERDIAAAGELCCFGNDLPTMYWNNQGEVELTVTLLSLGAAAAPAETAAPPQPERKPKAAPKPKPPAEAPPAPAAKPARKKKAVSGSAAAPETATAAPAAKPGKSRARSPKRSPDAPA